MYAVVRRQGDEPFVGQVSITHCVPGISPYNWTDEADGGAERPTVCDAGVRGALCAPRFILSGRCGVDRNVVEDIWYNVVSLRKGRSR